jgi:hypothetical protein
MTRNVIRIKMVRVGPFGREAAVFVLRGKIKYLDAHRIAR